MGTFPFLFGIMYGDIGHGLFLFVAGIWLCWNEDKLGKERMGEMAGGLFSGRYMITMMGFFGIYAGTIYNDMFSLSINLFGSRWTWGTHDPEDDQEAEQPHRYGHVQSVYPYGMDPAWKVASNELENSNSFKMKISVIFGVLQMFMGTCLKGINAIYFKERLDFFFEFLPMVGFACSLFMYMIFLIFCKWSINWQSRMLSASCVDPTSEDWGSERYHGDWYECEDQGYGCTPWGYSCTEDNEDTKDLCDRDLGGDGDGCQPPNLITTLIDIVLNPGEVDEPMFEGQDTLQNILLLIAFISVPVLLFAKPYIIHKRQKAARLAHADDDEYEDEDDHGFGELLIHQAIETIEFVLGMVSNTASYLRLWALSLAHSQLATVFWEKSILKALEQNVVATYISFGVFSSITFGVLLMMDVLECFLHALRLHWVEFQNKFFKADGLRFQPFCFKQIIAESTSVM